MKILNKYSSTEDCIIGLEEKDFKDLDRLYMQLCGRCVSLFIVPRRLTLVEHNILEHSIREGVKYTGKIVDALTGEDYTRKDTFRQEAYYRSGSSSQETEWIKRKFYNPSLTVSDMVLVDNIVKKVIKKYT